MSPDSHMSRDYAVTVHLFNNNIHMCTCTIYCITPSLIMCTCMILIYVHVCTPVDICKHCTFVLCTCLNRSFCSNLKSKRSNITCNTVKKIAPPNRRFIFKLPHTGPLRICQYHYALDLVPRQIVLVLPLA